MYWGHSELHNICDFTNSPNTAFFIHIFCHFYFRICCMLLAVQTVISTSGALY